MRSQAVRDEAAALFRIGINGHHNGTEAIAQIATRLERFLELFNDHIADELSILAGVVNGSQAPSRILGVAVTTVRDPDTLERFRT